MASIFTFQEEPPRVHSPWSTPGHGTPQAAGPTSVIQHVGNGSYTTSISKLEPERHDGPTEYKLHLLLRLRGMGSTASPLTYQSRQSRLQQLTTQLLWRLQQSSPFHSASNAKLILPVLPEATPRLGIPEQPAKLLPGLEESQGALYEIGVADDGTLMGLYEDELEESLANLRAMAASLGCVIDILRRVLVGQSGQHALLNGTDETSIATRLWVAEVLVRPDVRTPKIPSLKVADNATVSPFVTSDIATVSISSVACTEQMRVAVTGSTSTGKSSLVGTLTTSRLDNGRGRSRLSLLKHRHEIASGVTSSVAQELIGYRGHSPENLEVINYASGDISSWPDIHGLSSRLVFLSDSPGLLRYAKSTFRATISWKPDWTLLCVAADTQDIDVSGNASFEYADRHHCSISSTDQLSHANMSFAHLEVCLKLDLRLVIVVTKMDVATKVGLKTLLSRVLSILKQAGRVPVLLGAPSAAILNADENADIATQLSQVTSSESTQLETVLQRTRSVEGSDIVPIVLTSAVTGVGFGKLHTLLRELPISQTSSIFPAEDTSTTHSSTFHVDETFAIPPSRVYSANKQDHSADHGIVLCGHVAKGTLSIGDTLRLGPFWIDHDPAESSDKIHKSASFSNDYGRPPACSLSGEFSKSLQGDKILVSDSMMNDTTTAFLDVYIVSLRNLRLPVRSMSKGDTGTVGVQPVMQQSIIPLSRARKGMVLTSLPSNQLAGHRSFSVVFPMTAFASADSSPLILGGHAIAYLNSVRAAVKVIALVLHDENADSPSLVDVFDFDGENDADESEPERKVRITFKFVSSVEWMEVGDKALIVPTVTAAGPVSGPPTVAATALSGFVGAVDEVFT